MNKLTKKQQELLERIQREGLTLRYDRISTCAWLLSKGKSVRVRFDTFLRVREHLIKHEGPRSFLTDWKAE
jgi:hypothetical protein